MAKITAIKQQVKRKDRYSIYVDGRYAFSFSEDELVKSGVKKNQELSASELNNLKSEAVLDKAYYRTLNYISIRPRSQWEITDYLRKKGYDKAVARTVLAKVTKVGLVDDGAFARQWVEWRMNSRLRSTRQLRAELYKKRVSRDIVAEVLEDIDEDSQLAQVKEIIARKSHLSQYQDRQKLIAYLARQGFPYYLIKQALQKESE